MEVLRGTSLTCHSFRHVVWRRKLRSCHTSVGGCWSGAGYKLWVLCSHGSSSASCSPEILEVDFDDGKKFRFPAEFLRVESPAADSKGLRARGEAKVVSGRRQVGIISVEPVGNYGLRISFDDLHKTGIYSWGYLYHLGEHKYSLMKNYIKALREQRLSREPSRK